MGQRLVDWRSLIELLLLCVDRWLNELKGFYHGGRKFSKYFSYACQSGNRKRVITYPRVFNLHPDPLLAFRLLLL